MSRIKKCAYPMHGKSPRCNKHGTEIVIVSCVELVYTCKRHCRLTVEWARRNMARHERERKKGKKEHLRLFLEARRACLKRLKEGDVTLSLFFFNRDNLYRLEDKDLLVLINGKIPKER